MDQWTARSANFLAGKTLVALDIVGSWGERRVADRDTPETYERFCALVEDLADRMGVSPEEIELRMFAGGTGKNDWRSLVRRMI